MLRDTDAPEQEKLRGSTPPKEETSRDTNSPKQFFPSPSADAPAPRRQPAASSRPPSKAIDVPEDSSSSGPLEALADSRDGRLGVANAASANKAEPSQPEAGTANGGTGAAAAATAVVPAVEAAVTTSTTSAQKSPTGGLSPASRAEDDVPPSIDALTMGVTAASGAALSEEGGCAVPAEGALVHGGNSKDQGGMAAAKGKQADAAPTPESHVYKETGKVRAGAATTEGEGTAKDESGEVATPMSLTGRDARMIFKTKGKSSGLSVPMFCKMVPRLPCVFRVPMGSSGRHCLEPHQRET